MRFISTFIFTATLALAQTGVSPSGSVSTVDNHAAVKTLPHRSGTGSPNARDNCATAGETYFQTDATAGSNSWACTTTGTPGTWTLQGNAQAPVNYTYVNAYSSSIPYTIPSNRCQWLFSLTASTSSQISLPALGSGGVSAGCGVWVLCNVETGWCVVRTNDGATDNGSIYGLGAATGLGVGAASFTLQQQQEAWVITDGTNWYASWWSPPPYEPGLGIPGTNGYVLSSTTAGVRSWVAQTSGGVTQTIASGALALATSSISGSGGCQTVTAGSVNSAVATGVASTDTITWTPSGSIKGLTGYNPSTAQLQITPYPTAGYVNFDVCNPTSGAIVPGAVTLNWRVVR
jgi:hypothetical protein